ncbi:MAG: hypothetical protein KF723_10320 [Rhizobiaceae bacterium]|nr:hypothetical protein [Rhizobiaceae bacterium]
MILPRFATALLALCFSGAAHAQTGGPYAFLSEDGRTIAYSACDESESWQECVSHDLSCGEVGGLTLLLLGAEGGGFNARSTAKALLNRDWGQARVRFPAGGNRAAELTIHEISISLNDMNGDWDLTLQLYDPELLFQVVDERSVSSIKADIAGAVFDLTPNQDAGRKLLAFKSSCTRGRA